MDAVITDSAGRHVVPLFTPDFNPFLHLIEYHGIVLPVGTKYDVMVKVHQAHHFTYGVGRAEMRIQHWHSSERTEALNAAAAAESDRIAAEARARVGLNPEGN